MSDRKKYPFKVRFEAFDGEIDDMAENPTVVEVEIEAYTLNAAVDRLGRALTKLCEDTR